jgi:hypothetical protein
MNIQGRDAQVRHFQDIRQQELLAGRRSIATLHLPEEVIDYTDIIVDRSDDDILKGHYNNVQDRLATGLIPEDEVS